MNVSKLKLPIYSVNRTKILLEMEVLIDSDLLNIVLKNGTWQLLYDNNSWRCYKRIKKKRVDLGNFVYEQKVGPIPNPYLIDHKNNNPLDNRIDNLRLATRNENNRNSRPKINSSSKYKGVHWCKNKRIWIAQIQEASKHWYLGQFKNEIWAAKAYDKKALELFGNFAYLNFPEGENNG